MICLDTFIPNPKPNPKPWSCGDMPWYIHTWSALIHSYLIQNLILNPDHVATCLDIFIHDLEYMTPMNDSYICLAKSCFYESLMTCNNESWFIHDLEYITSKSWCIHDLKYMTWWHDLEYMTPMNESYICRHVMYSWINHRSHESWFIHGLESWFVHDLEYMTS